MRFFRNVQLVLYLTLVSVIGSYCKPRAMVPERAHISCDTYKANECNKLGYVGDPLTGECLPKCAGPCVDGKCPFYYCILTQAGIPTKELSSCPYVYNLERCGKGLCARKVNYCNEDYVISPYDSGECIRRCDKNTCVHGRCSPQGTCVCHLGYRPDPTNPKTCKRIPANCPNPQPSVCPKGYEPNINGDCRPACINQCTDVTCPPNITCKCPNGYEFNSTTSGCEMELNIAVDDVPETHTERMTEMGVNLYTPISAFIITILLGIVIVFGFIIIKLRQTIRKQSSPQKHNEQEICSGHYYSTPRFDKNSDDDGILIENVELYGEQFRHQQQETKIPP